MIVAMELFAAAQGVDFRREELGQSARLGRGTAAAYDLIRQVVPFLEHDDVMYPHFQAIHALITDGALVAVVDRAIGEK